MRPQWWWGAASGAPPPPRGAPGATRQRALAGLDGLSFTVLLEQERDGGYTALCPALPGCLSQGETRQEALVNIASAVGLVLYRWERLWAIPLETRGVVEEERARILAARRDERPPPGVALERVQVEHGPLGRYLVTVPLRGPRGLLRRRPVDHDVVLPPGRMAVVTVPRVPRLRPGVVRALLRLAGAHDDEIASLVPG